MRIMRDLVTEGNIRKKREGRMNHIGFNTHAPLRRQDARDAVVGELLRALQNDG